MKKILPILCCCMLLCKFASAYHIKGGWIQYKFLAKASDTSSTYQIVMYVYRTCSTPSSLPMPVRIAIYDAVTNTEVKSISINNSIANSQYDHGGDTKKQTRPPCSNIPDNAMPCYAITTFTTTVELKNNPNGYIMAASDATRTTTIQNLNQAASSTKGISFTAYIPGNNNNYHINSNPEFIFKDTALLCYNAKFSYSYQATDADDDSLSFSFGDALDGMGTSPGPPPYKPMTYVTGYSGLTPLGPGVSIDPKTGTISGTAPATPGLYVVAVYVHEWRNGVKISSTKKEMEIGIGNCSLSPVELKKVYLNCDNYTITPQNEAFATNIVSYQWDFGVPNSTTDVSTSPTPSFTYADTGIYTAKLVVANNTGCKDSATAEVKIYPGFTPLFEVTGACIQKPIEFADKSFVKYGSISVWSWNFGDNTTTNDVANTQNASYQYPAPVTTVATMNITASTGCAGSFTQTVIVYAKPTITVPFRDTLICSIDTLPLSAQISHGSIRWSPNYRISDINSLHPRVDPKDTTEYKAIVTDNGCIDSTVIKVNVLDFITVQFAADTGICRTDHVTLHPVSDALSFRWRESTNAGSLNSYSVKEPIATPLTTTTYYLTANLGYCQDSAVTTVYVSPYPIAQLGSDTVLCFGHRTQLSAYTEAANFTWSPVSSLTQANTLHPFAGPVRTTSYIFTATDTMYCLKPVSDTITIQVIPAFNVFAGRDTAAGLNQPLQLIATGADPSYSYTWTPATFLDNNGIANPVMTADDNTYDVITYTVKASSPQGCAATDDIKISLYSNGPEIYVPNAFTPNGDGKNDILKPILIGVSQFHSFIIYNRWGQILFTSSQPGSGWDGTYKGVKQAPGTYVFTAQGKDYAGKSIFRKGTVVLIR